MSTGSGGGSLGRAAFAAAFKPSRMLLVGADGVPVDEFLLRPVRLWISA